MHRDPLRLLLERYVAAWPAEHELRDRFLAFVDEHEDCLLRSCAPGHVTASAWILSPDRTAALLTHHKKLGKWLQLGGHVDGEASVERACLREAQEESGMQRFEWAAWGDRGLTPLDLDVHTIPGRPGEPQHLHWDVRFLLVAEAGQTLSISEESNRLEWAPVARLQEFTDEESVLRLQRKAVEVLR